MQEIEQIQSVLAQKKILPNETTKPTRPMVIQWGVVYRFLCGTEFYRDIDFVEWVLDYCGAYRCTMSHSGTFTFIASKHEIYFFPINWKGVEEFLYGPYRNTFPHSQWTWRQKSAILEYTLGIIGALKWLHAYHGYTPVYRLQRTLESYSIVQNMSEKGQIANYANLLFYLSDLIEIVNGNKLQPLQRSVREFLRLQFERFGIYFNHISFGVNDWDFSQPTG